MEDDRSLASTTAWLHAIRTSSYADARLLLPPGHGVNICGARGETALHVLARVSYTNKLPDITALLLDGADPHATDDQGRTPLRFAQELNNANVIRYLILHDDLLRALTTRLGREPLLADVVIMMEGKSMEAFREEVRLRVTTISDELVTAARNGDLTAVRSIVESGAISVDAVKSGNGETAFSAALGAGHRHVCEYLLTKGAHVYAPCLNKPMAESALTAAVAQGDVEFVRRLIARGATRAVSDPFSHSCPLAEAVKLGSIGMVHTLLVAGVEASSLSGWKLPWPAWPAVLGVANPDDVTPWWLLQMACWLQDAPMIQYLFTRFGVLTSREMMSRFGARALFLAVCQDNAELVVDLLDRGASINQPINHRLTAVVAPVAINSVDMLRLVLNRGGDPSVTHTSLLKETGHPQGLLATAIHANAMDCAYELLQIETRPELLDHALALATWRHKVEYVCAHLDVALPSTVEALRACHATCPLVLDLLLSRCCSERYHVSDLYDQFRAACRSHAVDLVSVFLAHGIDINGDTTNANHARFTTMLQQNGPRGTKIARYLIENGAEVRG